MARRRSPNDIEADIAGQVRGTMEGMRWDWFLFGSFVLMLAGCAGEARRDDTAADVAAIRAVSDARAEAFRQGDGAGIAVHFTEDGLLMAPGSPAQRGREAVRAYYQSIFDAYETGLESG